LTLELEIGGLVYRRISELEVFLVCLHIDPEGVLWFEAYVLEKSPLRAVFGNLAKGNENFRLKKNWFKFILMVRSLILFLSTGVPERLSCTNLKVKIKV